MRIRLRISEGNDSDRVIISDRDGEEIGFIDCLLSDGVVDVRWIELAVQRRRWGLGAEAVRLLEAEAAARWGARGIRAQVPVDVGPALYFWLRLGYRPEVGGMSKVGGEVGRMAVVRGLEDDR